jgi:ParB/RepB/Spo0J family partition protein
MPHTITQLPVDAIAPGDNDRRVFEARKLRELADSILEHGLAQPISVRSNGAGQYQIIAGERRWRAHKLAGIATIPAIIRDDLDDEGAAAIMLLENVQRADLNPIDEGYAYKKRMAEFGWTAEEIARRANVSAGRVKDRVVLLDLVPEAQKLIGDGQLSPGYGVAMHQLDSNRQRIAMRYLREAKRPTLSEYREVCSQLLAEQAQESMFNLDDYLVQANAAVDEEEARKETRRFPVNDGIPAMEKVLGGTGAMLEHYIARLLAGGHEAEAAVVGRVYEGLLSMNCAKLPAESPLDAVAQA